MSEEKGELSPVRSSGASSPRGVSDAANAAQQPGSSRTAPRPVAIELTSVGAGHGHAMAVKRSPSPEDALSEDEEEQIKMEAQIGMMLTAASKNNVKRIRGLLNAGVPPGAFDYDGRTALHLACSEGHLEAVQLLIDEGADPNAKDRFGSTPLDDAMHGGHHEVVSYLQSKKARHGGLDKLQAKLIEACAKGDLAAAQKLLTKDIHGNLVPGSAAITPNCHSFDRRTPLHFAVAEGHTEIVALLLANGADPHAADRWGLTPLAEADRKAARVGSDPIKALFREGGFLPHEKESIFSFFALFFGAWEVMMMILIGLFCVYGEGAEGGEHTDPAEDNVAAFRDPASEHQLTFTRTYSLFQDVHVMIFMGFGFLMVFLRKHGYTSVGLTFLLGAFVIQWYQLCAGFWADAFTGEWKKIPLGLEQLILGDFAAGAVLITFGVLLGKVNPAQMMFVAIIETIGFSLNERIGLRIQANDVGGSMTIHMFGAFFGYGATWMLTPKEAHGHENNAANYHSDIMAMVGTLFLWMFWPSFNAALCVSSAQERAVVNTLFAVCGSCVVAFIASHIWRRERKFHMVDIQNATLAGGVAMGTCADLLIEPGSAIGIGGLGGLVSVLGYVYVQPFLEKRLGLHDTCGVNNLHGMPSLIGAFAGVIAAATAEIDGFHGKTGYGKAQLYNSYPARAGADPRSANEQAAVQFAYICTTIGIGLVGGFIAGHFATLRCFKPTEVKDMYQDSEYWEVPQLETPFYFDHRGEIDRDAIPVPAAAEEVEGAETSKVGANPTVPDNARLLDLIQTLETRLNQLTRRMGAPSATPLAGLSTLPPAHPKTLVNPGGEAEYPASQMTLGSSVVPSPSDATTAAGVAIDGVHVVAADAEQQGVVLHTED